MQLLVIRHANAGTRDPSATEEEDALRPLTEKGRRKMAKGAEGLRQLVPALDVLAASPLVRARQTADIVAAEYGGVAIVTTPVLEPATPPASFLEWLHAQRGDTIAVVGHEPDLGVLVTWLLTGVEESRVPLRKGAACLLELASPPRQGESILRWALASSQLRRIASSS